MKTGARYRPVVGNMAVLSIDLEKGHVRRYVRTQPVAGMRALPLLTTELEIVAWQSRYETTFYVPALEKLRETGEL